MPRPAARWALVAALTGALATAGCTQVLAPAPSASTAELPPAGSAEGPATGAAGSALQALAEVEVKGRAPRTGYDRALFGPRWADTDRNGCDTRNDVLARDLTDETVEDGTRDCVVLSGTLADPYSGGTIAFRRGEDTSDDVQIDHVVALSDAWQKGAQGWDEARRTLFANDPLNLLAVDGRLNQQKGDGDAATWLPPNRSYRCAYVARQVAVKAAYDLWATQAEHDAMARVLSACPAEPVPAGHAAPASTPAAPAPASTTVEAAPPAVAYADCTAVRAAGAAPVRRGDPGYAGHLDGDGDGVGCE